MRDGAKTLVSIGLLLAAAIALGVDRHGDAVPIRKPLAGLPATLGDWRLREGRLLDDPALEDLKLTDYTLRRYENAAGRSLWLYVGYWDTQRKGAQIHSPKNCLPGGGWEPLDARVEGIDMPGGAPIEVNRYLLQKDSDQQLVLYWYHSQGEAVAGEIHAKLRLVRNSILRHRSDGAIVRISAMVTDGVPATWDRLARFVRAVYPSLHEFLPD